MGIPPGRGANVTVGRISDMIQKNSVPQQGVKPWPLAIRVSIIPLDHRGTRFPITIYCE